MKSASKATCSESSAFEPDVFRSNYSDLQVASNVTISSTVGAGVVPRSQMQAARAPKARSSLERGCSAASSFRRGHVSQRALPQLSGRRVECCTGVCRNAPTRRHPPACRHSLTVSGQRRISPGNPRTSRQHGASETVSYSAALLAGITSSRKRMSTPRPRYFFGNNGNNDPEQMHPAMHGLMAGCHSRAPMDVGRSISCSRI